MDSLFAAFPVTPGLFAAALAITLAAAALQGTIGVGFSVVSVPLLVLIDRRLAPVPQLLMAVPLVLLMALRERRAIDAKSVVRASIGRVPGAALGAVLLSVASAETLDFAVALIVILSAGLIGGGVRLRRRPSTEVGAGFLSGVTGVVASMGGPPVALLFVGERPSVVRANLAAIYSVGVFVSVGARVAADAITWTDVTMALWLMPGLFGGLLVSRFFVRRVNAASVARAVLIVCVLAGCALVVRAAGGISPPQSTTSHDRSGG
ncbi:MAG: sulfite exporter TauE/SafE family protein [Deltaproteobacteria bacterium]|nr:sulfite exporter TauE/SafE family protein [Deltaproteobacteria bacterium]